MNKVIIRTREKELTRNMHSFGNNCAKQFLDSLESGQYGKGWESCSYSNHDYSLSCWVQLLKSGNISACVFTK